MNGSRPPRSSAKTPAGFEDGAPRDVPGPDLRHHGDAEVRDAGDGLVDLAVNVRAGTPPAWLRARLAASLGGLAAYPDERAARAAVAARHRVPVRRVLLTSGAAEAFVLLARAAGVAGPVVVHPQFTEPEAALREAGHRVRRVLLDAGDGFRLRSGAVPEDADLVVVGNPTNPTSVLHPAAEVVALARPGRLLVVDEAFMDAVPGERESLASRLDVPGLVVLRSLTKTWGLAGLRIGYVLAAPETIAALERAQPLWPVSTPALAAAEACMEPRALAEAARAAATVAADRAYLVAALTRLGHGIGTQTGPGTGVDGTATESSGPAAGEGDAAHTHGTGTGTAGTGAGLGETATESIAEADGEAKATHVTGTDARTARTAAPAASPVLPDPAAPALPDPPVPPALPALPALHVVQPAQAPFVLVRTPGAHVVRARLRERGFAVRRGDTFPGLGPEWLRIAVRDRATTDRFLTALADALREATGR